MVPRKTKVTLKMSMATTGLSFSCGYVQGMHYVKGPHKNRSTSCECICWFSVSSLIGSHFGSNVPLPCSCTAMSWRIMFHIYSRLLLETRLDKLHWQHNLNYLTTSCVCAYMCVCACVSVYVCVSIFVRTSYTLGVRLVRTVRQTFSGPHKDTEVSDGATGCRPAGFPGSGQGSPVQTCSPCLAHHVRLCRRGNPWRWSGRSRSCERPPRGAAGAGERERGRNLNWEPRRWILDEAMGGVGGRSGSLT